MPVFDFDVITGSAAPAHLVKPAAPAAAPIVKEPVPEDPPELERPPGRDAAGPRR